METIRVELTPPGNGRDRASLLVIRGETDITDQIISANMIVLRSYLPAANRQYMSVGRQRYVTLESYLRNGGDNRYRDGRAFTLPLPVLTDAIRAYVTELATDQTTVSVTEDQGAVVEALAAGEPSFLTLGGRMYRLQATEHSDAGIKLLKRAREQAAAAVRAHRDAAIARVNAECAVQRAQVDRERLQLATDRAEFARGGQCVIPNWLRGIEVKGSDQGWLHVRQQFRYKVDKFTVPEYTITTGRQTRQVALEWDAVAAGQAAVKVITYWLKVNPALGTYDVAHSYIDRESPQLPHAGHSSFCVQPDGMPQRCSNMDHVQVITERIARAFRVVNLSSLLHTDAVNTNPTQPLVPESVRLMVRNELPQPRHLSAGVRIVERDRPAEVWEAADLPAAPAEAGTTAAAWQAAAGQAGVDMIPPNLIERIREYRAEYPEVDIATARQRVIDSFNEDMRARDTEREEMAALDAEQEEENA